MECSEDEFEDLCLDFTFTVLGGVQIELVPGGADRFVTLADRAEFCELARRSCMNQFDSQIALIRSGLDDYNIPAVALLLWTPDEFQTQVAGSLEIPVEALRKGIQVSGNNDQKTYFWAAVERMTNEQRSMMLKFATGRSRLPLHMTLNLGTRMCLSLTADVLTVCLQEVDVGGMVGLRLAALRCTCRHSRMPMTCTMVL